MLFLKKGVSKAKNGQEYILPQTADNVTGFKVAIAKYIGVYSCNTWPSTSAFSPNRKHNWFVWEDGWGRYRAQLLDAAFQPLDNPRVVTAAEFKKHFKAQPNVLVTPVSQLDLGTQEEDSQRQNREVEEARRVRQDIAELSAKLGLELEVRPETSGGDAPVPQAQRAGTVIDAPQKEDDEAAAQLDDASRTEFVLALTRWRRGDKHNSMDTFQRILKLKEHIVPAHKHMYTDFAIDLRKCALYTLAKEFYRRAVQLAPEDCNARFNLARIHFEIGEIHNALKELDEALRLEAEFPYAEQFKQFLIEHYPKQAKSYLKQVKTDEAETVTSRSPVDEAKRIRLLLD